MGRESASALAKASTRGCRRALDSVLSITNEHGSIPNILGERDILDRCLRRLRELPFVQEAELLPPPTGAAGRADALLRIGTPEGKAELLVEAKRTHLTRTLADGILAQAARLGGKPWILFAPHVGRPLARHLAAQGVNFVDLAGNCRLQIGRRHFAAVEGRPPEKPPRQGRGAGPSGLQVIFAILVRSELLNAPVRALAAAAGVAAATAAEQIARLREDGLIRAARQERKIIEPRRLLDLWLKGYETLVRPKLLIGRYRAREEDPAALERRIEEALGAEVGWAFGGSAAAFRLTGYYRGPETIVHVQDAGFDPVQRLRALPAAGGPLTLLRAPGRIAFEGALPRTVAPLLVYTELLFAGDKRAREAAIEVQKAYLRRLA